MCCVCESVLGGQDNLLLFAIIFRDSGNFLIIAVVAGKRICLALYMVPFNFSFFRNFHSAQAGETCVCVFPASTRAKSVSRYTDSPASMSDCCCVLIDQIRHITYTYIEPSIMPLPPACFFHSNCELLILDFISHLTVKRRQRMLKIHFELTISLQLTFSVSTLMNSCS